MRHIYTFKPLYKQTLWGGRRIMPFKGLPATADNVGESWEISGVKGNETTVSGGKEDGLTLSELVKKEGARLVGKENIERFGDEFPLLIKFIDAKEDLSIQVHPDDALAYKRHHTNGKTEMWYVVDAEPGATLLSGFNQEMTPDKYVAAVSDHTIGSLMNVYEIHSGDVFFLPAGRVHSIGKGAFVAEIQQTSDITYRIYDFDRKDKNGKTRELHTELAKDAIDYTYYKDCRQHYTLVHDGCSELVNCKYFTTDLYDIDKSINVDLSSLDSFVTVIVIEGSITLDTGKEKIALSQGSTALVTADTESMNLIPVGKKAKILTTFIEKH